MKPRSRLVNFDVVADMIRHVAAQEVTPRFRALGAGEVEEKAPGEVVTAADRACELLLGKLLRDVADVPVVGEEAATQDGALQSLIESAPAVWVVDPLDGTSNFAAGSPDHSVMVAFVENGVATASWMWSPQLQKMAVAGRDAGAFLNGKRVTAPEPSGPRGGWRGVVKHRFLPDDVKATVKGSAERFAELNEGRNCAGLDYPDLVAGATNFLVYWRTLPWDHAPGVLFAEEAGCAALRPNGDPFRCEADRGGLVVAHVSVCDQLRRTLLAPG